MFTSTNHAVVDQQIALHHRIVGGFNTAWVSNWPMPGIDNVSVTTEPGTSRPAMKPITVVMEISASVSACCTTTVRRDSPLARAVRM